MDGFDSFLDSSIDANDMVSIIIYRLKSKNAYRSSSKKIKELKITYDRELINIILAKVIAEDISKVAYKKAKNSDKDIRNIDIKIKENYEFREYKEVVDKYGDMTIFVTFSIDNSGLLSPFVDELDDTIVAPYIIELKWCGFASGNKLKDETEMIFTQKLLGIDYKNNNMNIINLSKFNKIDNHSKNFGYTDEDLDNEEFDATAEEDTLDSIFGESCDFGSEEDKSKKKRNSIYISDLK